MLSLRISPPPKEIKDSFWLPLPRGLFALVDIEDVERLKFWNWSALTRKGYSPYAFRRQMGKTIYLHRFIVNAPDGMDVDHIDGNGLNCKKSNLRICTHAQNQYNYRKCTSPTSSKFKGVHFDRSKKKWVSRIKKNGITNHLGYFSSEYDAALAYDQSAVILFGQFSNLNLRKSLKQEETKTC